MLLDYIRIARPDHWPKNVFVLPGIFLALLVSEDSFRIFDAVKIIYGLIVVCLAASTNYVINEILDAKFDRLHPTKKDRPLASGRVKVSWAYGIWVSLMLISLYLAWTINTEFFLVIILFILQGLAYNIPPVRTKDIPFLDVITESVNNPIRLLLGWFMINTAFLPTLSLVLAYWMVGAFFMSSKRYSEYTMIKDHTKAVAYRKSFKYYSEKKLLISMFYYASLFSFFMGIFLVRYRIELILSIPFIALVIAYYLRMSFWANSPVQAPELLSKQKGFMILLVSCIFVMTLLFLVDIPFVRELFSPTIPYY